jgi:hypothetical protein
MGVTYQTEFPDFPEADMPVMPEGFVDASWKNDACPNFESKPLGLRVWIDYVDVERREFTVDVPRFVLYRIDDGGAPLSDDPIAATDDWNEVLAVILGVAFTARCVEAFTADQMAEVKRRNVDHADDGACATHDFADANMIMLDAFFQTMGHEPGFLDGTDEKGIPSPETEADIALWNAAWEWAKKTTLTAKEA